MVVSQATGLTAGAVAVGAAIGAAVTRLSSSSSSSSPASPSSSTPSRPQRTSNSTSNHHGQRASDRDGRASPLAHMPPSGGGKYDEDRRTNLRKIAQDTLNAIKIGHYEYKGIDQLLREKVEESKKYTQFFGPQSGVTVWASSAPKISSASSQTHISVLNISTLDAARLLENVYKNFPGEQATTGVLNFASATKPGGGFRNGAEAQEESIARSSTLYPTLTETEEAAKFYRLHSLENAQNSLAYYSHAIVYSPKVTVFRDDDGAWTYPFDVDVLSCAAVNAGEVRKAANAPVGTGVEVGIEKEMAERMGRILYVFEQHNVRNLVLGTFGTGVFRNNVGIVARLWAHLLIVDDARFKDSFDRVIFAITGEETFAEFQSAFDAWGQQRAAGHGRNQNQNQNRRRPAVGELISL